MDGLAPESGVDIAPELSNEGDLEPDISLGGLGQLEWDPESASFISLMTAIANSPVFWDGTSDDLVLQLDSNEYRFLDQFENTTKHCPDGSQSASSSHPVSVEFGAPSAALPYNACSIPTTSTGAHGISFEKQAGTICGCPGFQDPVGPSNSSLPVTVGPLVNETDADPDCVIIGDGDMEPLNSTEGRSRSESEQSSRTLSAAAVEELSDNYMLTEEPEVGRSEPAVPENPGSPTTKLQRRPEHESQPHTDGIIYPKPPLSYSDLSVLALKNSITGRSPVTHIYKFICDHFPYFNTAPKGWKNSVRHCLSKSRWFEKVEPAYLNGKKGYSWAMKPDKGYKMDWQVKNCIQENPTRIFQAMSAPENFYRILRGEMKRDYSSASDDAEEENLANSPFPPIPAELQAQFSADIARGTMVLYTPVTMSQIRATLQKQHALENTQNQKSEISDSEPGTITNVQGYTCDSSGFFSMPMNSEFEVLNNSSNIIR